MRVHAACAAREVTQADVQIPCTRIVVARPWDHTSRNQARTVVVRSVGVVAGVAWIRTSGDFIFVADAVAVCVVQANTIAVVTLRRKVTAVVVQRGVGVVVARRLVGTSRTARKVTIRVDQVLGTGVVVASKRQRTSADQATSVVVRGKRVVARVRGIGTSPKLILVTHPVAVRVVQAHAVAVVPVFCVVAASVVLSGVAVVVACVGIRTARAAREVTEAEDLVIRVRRVVACTWNQTSADQTAAVLHCRVGVVARVGGVRTS